MTTVAKSVAQSPKKGNGKMNDMPPWVSQVLRGGGWAAALTLFYFAVITPLRDDFRDFKTVTAQNFKSVQADLKALNASLTGDLRDRLASVSQEVVTSRERVRALSERMKECEIALRDREKR